MYWFKTTKIPFNLSKRKSQHERSEYIKIYMEITQGTVLWPLLFVIYMNDIFSRIEDNQTIIVFFADDTVSWPIV